MKKVFIACFFAILMLMVPFTAVSQTAEISDIKNVSNDNNVNTLNITGIKFYITNADYNQIIGYIEDYIPEERKEEAYDIVDYIITPHAFYGYEVDMTKLGEKWVEYGFHSIDPDIIANADTLEILEALLRAEWVFDVLGEFVNFITGITPIRNRLGWFRRVLNDMYYFCKEAAYIVIDISVDTLQQLKALANVVNFVMSVPETLYLALDDLVKGNGQAFKNKIAGLISDFAEVIIGIIPYAIGLLSAFERIFNFLDVLLTFIVDMGTETPWNNEIHVQGRIIKNFPGSVNVTCRGHREENVIGTFDFYVDPNPDETSLPQNEYYGIHDCTITVEQDGVKLKESTPILSYVFSDGSIFWPFIIIKSRSRSTGFNTYLMEKFNNFLTWMQHIFPNFFRLINGINTLSI